MPNGSVNSALMIFFVINLLAVIFSPTLGVSSIGDVVVFKLLSSSDYNAKTISELNHEIDSGLNKDLTSSTTTTTNLGFLDGLSKVFSFIITLISFGFAIFAMLISLNAPFVLCALIGLPIAIGFYVSIVSAIRGFSI